MLKNKRLDFLVRAIILTLYCTLFDVLDRFFDLGGYIFSLSKLIALVFILFTVKNEKIFARFSPKYLFLILLSFIATFVLCYSKTEFSGNIASFIKNFIFLAITIFLEELFFRSNSFKIFDEGGVISLKNASFIIFVFLICNLPIFIFRDINASILTIIYLLALDFLILGIFLSSKNVILCFLCSLFPSGTELYFTEFSSISALYNSWVFYLIYTLTVVFYIGVGSIFILRNTVRK